MTARVIDLTQPLAESMPRWPQTEALTAEILASFDGDGYYERRITLPEHVGTHVDAPAHFDPAGACVDEIPPGALVTRAHVLDASDECGDDPDFALEARELERLESEQAVRFDRGNLALLHFGWDRYLHDAHRYVGSGPRFPGLAPSAGTLLVARGVAGIGVDTLGVEPGGASAYPLHRITLRAGLFHVEGLVGLGALIGATFTVVVAPLRLVGGSGAPARVLALMDEA